MALRPHWSENSGVHERYWAEVRRPKTVEEVSRLRLEATQAKGRGDYGAARDLYQMAGDKNRAQQCDGQIPNWAR